DQYLNAKTKKAAAALKSGHAISTASISTISVEDMPWPEPVARDIYQALPESQAYHKDSLTDEFEDAMLLELTSKPRPKSGRVKYTCKTCHLLMWGKPGLRVLCEDCDQRLHEVM